MAGKNLKLPQVVVIGGGTGVIPLLQGLRRRGDCGITYIGGSHDAGGSSGRLLKLGLTKVPPGDHLNALVALSPLENVGEFLQRRFSQSRSEKIRGHSVGNILIAALSNFIGEDYLEALTALQEAVECPRGMKVLPATLQHPTLCVRTNHDRIIRGEERIDRFVYEDRRETNGELILEAWLESAESDLQLIPEARQAIERADLAVIGAGSFFGSLVGVLLVEGVREALSPVKVAYVVNLTTVRRETPGWTARDFVLKLEDVLGRQVDVVVCNSHVPSDLLEKYTSEAAEAVEVNIPPSVWEGRRIIIEDFLPSGSQLARHDSGKIARVVAQLAREATKGGD